MPGQRKKEDGAETGPASPEVLDVEEVGQGEGKETGGEEQTRLVEEGDEDVAERRGGDGVALLRARLPTQILQQQHRRNLKPNPGSKTKWKLRLGDRMSGDWVSGGVGWKLD